MILSLDFAQVERLSLLPVGFNNNVAIGSNPEIGIDLFQGNVAETHLKDSEKHILSFRARVPHFGGTTSQERFTWVDLFMYCIF